ncbi:MAG: hypothetical protein ABEJ04_05125 [Halobacteriaceae archaeon]
MSAEADPVDVDHAPARLSSALSLLFGLVSAAASAALPTVSLPVGVLGIGALGAGLVADSRRLVTAGAGGLFAAALAGGAFGLPVELVLVGVAASVLAWDVGENAISVGHQLGRGSDTSRGELVHAAASTVVGALVTVVGYVLYRLATGGQPVVALVLLLSGAVFLLWATGR